MAYFSVGMCPVAFCFSVPAAASEQREVRCSLAMRGSFPRVYVPIIRTRELENVGYMYCNYPLNRCVLLVDSAVRFLQSRAKGGGGSLSTTLGELREHWVSERFKSGLL